jgi:hypothetical protein
VVEVSFRSRHIFLQPSLTSLSRARDAALLDMSGLVIAWPAGGWNGRYQGGLSPL